METAETYPIGGNSAEDPTLRTEPHIYIGKPIKKALVHCELLKFKTDF
jgi:hypothetical protein